VENPYDRHPRFVVIIVRAMELERPPTSRPAVRRDHTWRRRRFVGDEENR
jgi:hypothetical protein